MTAWEVPITRTVRDDYTAIVPFVAQLMDQAATDLGLNSVSIGIGPAIERTDDCEARYINGALTEGQFVSTCAYISMNDNNDPNVANPSGFQFTLVDWQIEKLVLPLKQRVESRGEKLRVVLRFVDFGPSPFEHLQSPSEYAELMLVVFTHMQSKYGFVPDGIDVLNEPDLARWDAPALGNAVASSGSRLAAAGYRPAFIVPSTTDKGRAVPYLDTIMANTTARPYVKQVAWHCYSDSGTNSSTAIGSKVVQYGISSSMTECWADANTYLLLHEELKTSRNSAWQLATFHSARGYYDVSPTGQTTLRPRAQFIRQYFKYVRAGARRIDAVTGNAAFDPVAFINTDGKYVVVVKASSGGSFSIGNLPSGTYGVFYTIGPGGLTVSNYNVNLPDQSISGGQGLTTSIPSAGVITVYAKTGSSTAVTGGAIERNIPTQNAFRGTLRVGRADDMLPKVAPNVPPATRVVEPTPPPTITWTEPPGWNRTAMPAWPKSTAVTTASGLQLRLEQITDDIVEPTDLAFTPDGRLFVAERDGRVRVVREGRLLPQPALALQETGDDREQLLAMAVDPRFERTPFIYVVSTTRSKSGAPTFRLARFREASNTLADRIVLLDEIAAASRPSASLRFGADGKLFAAFDEAGVARLGGDLASPNGKLLRLNPDGTTPDDQAGGSPLFAYAYHSPRGFDWHPTTQTLWMADRDASDASTLSVLATSAGPRKRGVLRATLMLPRETWASSVAFYRGGSSATMRDNLLVASEEGRHLLRIQLDSQESTRVAATERLLQDVVGGIRVVAVGPDGAIYLGAVNTLWKLVVTDR